ncbi:two-component system sensor histidine kinase YesM [Saliterribacillus persicus]|uniref:histidine kinase n=2 Tax=Saliterribacillus persicus TaxID=930114 RepID=A0A368XPB7_9BACI|nr:two-component system sensor histidine kinase YesM [Saliterribacillus persicus]
MIFNRLRNSRLMSKLMITYFLLTVIPISVLGFVAYNQYTKSIEKQVGEYIPKLLEQANININNQLNEYRSLPDSLYNANQVIEVLRKDSYQNNSNLFRDEFLVNNYLSKMYMNSGNNDILGVFILSKNRLFTSSKADYSGFQLENFPSTYGENLDLQGRTEFILPNQSDLAFQGDPPFILMMRELRDYENQETLGTIFVAIRLTFIEQAMESLYEDQKPTIWLTNEEGVIIYHTKRDRIGTLDPRFRNYPKINGSFRTTDFNDNQLISTNKFPNMNWYSYHRIALEDLMKETNQVRNGTILVFLIFVILSSVISVILAWNVSHPLQKLARLMKRVEKGDFKVDLPINKKDEIGLLAKSFNSMIQEIEHLIKMNYQIELRQKDAELYALQSQINPHFMYNTLETIGYAVEEEEKEIVSRMVALLGRMLRYSLNNKEKVVPLKQELGHIEDYLTIQQFRFEDRIDFQIKDIVGNDSYYVPKFILQPIVENAIKYGLEANYKVRIKVMIEEGKNNKLIIKIEDNGPGIKEADLSQLNLSFKSNPMIRRDENFGLINVHARIALIYGENYGLEVESVIGKGTTVMIRLPADESERGGEK